MEKSFSFFVLLLVLGLPAGVVTEFENEND